MDAICGIVSGWMDGLVIRTDCLFLVFGAHTRENRKKKRDHAMQLYSYNHTHTHTHVSLCVSLAIFASVFVAVAVAVSGHWAPRVAQNAPTAVVVRINSV